MAANSLAAADDRAEVMAQNRHGIAIEGAAKTTCLELAAYGDLSVNGHHHV
jgi:hypothetical protein